MPKASLSWAFAGKALKKRRLIFQRTMAGPIDPAFFDWGIIFSKPSQWVVRPSGQIRDLM